MDPGTNHVGDELRALERTLGELVPSAARLDIAQTMYRAGQASARAHRPASRLWPVATSALAIVSLTLAALLAIPKQPQIVYVPRALSEPASAARIAQDDPTQREHGVAGETGTARPQQMVPEQPAADAVWLSARSRMRADELTVSSLWSLTPTVQSSGATRPAYCARDWRLLLNDLAALEHTGESADGVGSQPDHNAIPQIESL
ncbi:MAG: hypothetical protein MUF48_12110 [Pirellulaceae bacterium]|jgi:hypothetical protein|nr:hypothetical protein [Pirellulaceae bacterium]